MSAEGNDREKPRANLARANLQASTGHSVFFFFRNFYFKTMPLALRRLLALSSPKFTWLKVKSKLEPSPRLLPRGQWAQQEMQQ